MASKNLGNDDEDFKDEYRKDIKDIKLMFESLLKPPQSDDLMDTVDAMAFLKVTRRTLYKYRTKDGFPSIQMDGGKIFYSREKLLQYFADQTKKNK